MAKSSKCEANSGRISFASARRHSAAELRWHELSDSPPMRWCPQVSSVQGHLVVPRGLVASLEFLARQVITHQPADIYSFCETVLQQKLAQRQVGDSAADENKQQHKSSSEKNMCSSTLDTPNPPGCASQSITSFTSIGSANNLECSQDTDEQNSGSASKIAGVGDETTSPCSDFPANQAEENQEQETARSGDMFQQEYHTSRHDTDEHTSQRIISEVHLERKNRSADSSSFGRSASPEMRRDSSITMDKSDKAGSMERWTSHRSTSSCYRKFNKQKTFRDDQPRSHSVGGSSVSKKNSHLPYRDIVDDQAASSLVQEEESRRSISWPTDDKQCLLKKYSPSIEEIKQPREKQLVNDQIGKLRPACITNDVQTNKPCVRSSSHPSEHRSHSQPLVTSTSSTLWPKRTCLSCDNVNKQSNLGKLSVEKGPHRSTDQERTGSTTTPEQTDDLSDAICSIHPTNEEEYDSPSNHDNFKTGVAQSPLEQTSCAKQLQFSPVSDSTKHSNTSRFDRLKTQHVQMLDRCISETDVFLDESEEMRHSSFTSVCMKENVCLKIGSKLEDSLQIMSINAKCVDNEAHETVEKSQVIVSGIVHKDEQKEVSDQETPNEDDVKASSYGKPAKLSEGTSFDLDCSSDLMKLENDCESHTTLSLSGSISDVTFSEENICDAEMPTTPFPEADKPKLNDIETSELNISAIIIQSAFRGWKSRNEILKQNNAAQKIQSVFRKSMSGRIFSHDNELASSQTITCHPTDSNSRSVSLEVESPYAMKTGVDAIHAVAKIQALFRGWSTRNMLKHRERYTIPKPEETCETSGSSCEVDVFRDGLKTANKKQYEAENECTHQSSREDETAKSLESIQSEIADTEQVASLDLLSNSPSRSHNQYDQHFHSEAEENVPQRQVVAATLIQSHYRGYLVRRSSPSNMPASEQLATVARAQQTRTTPKQIEMNICVDSTMKPADSDGNVGGKRTIQTVDMPTSLEETHIDWTTTGNIGDVEENYSLHSDEEGCLQLSRSQISASFQDLRESVHEALKSVEMTARLASDMQHALARQLHNCDDLCEPHSAACYTTDIGDQTPPPPHKPTL